MSGLPIREIFGMGDEEREAPQAESGSGDVLSQVAATIQRDAVETLKRWKESGALSGDENQVMLAKLAFKEAGENIALNPEMEKLYRNLKKF
jgi:hypothetical protein